MSVKASDARAVAEKYDAGEILAARGMPNALELITTRGVHDVPVFAGGDAIGLLLELCACCLEASGKPEPFIAVSSDDAAAIAWALRRVGGALARAETPPPPQRGYIKDYEIQ